MRDYISDEDLAAEIGCDPDDFYEEFHRRFRLNAWCGLMEVLSPRPGRTQPRYRLTQRAMEEVGSRMCFLDESYLQELGAYNGAEWSAPEYADLEWAAEMPRSEAIHFLRRRREDRRRWRYATLNFEAMASHIQWGKDHRGITASDCAAMKAMPVDMSSARRLPREQAARHRTWGHTVMKSAPITVFLCLLLVTTAWAGIHENVAAYDCNIYETALCEPLPIAETDDTNKRFKFSLMYASANDANQNAKAAIWWSRKTVAPDQRFLNDYAKAARWFRRADENDDAVAQFNLGIMYYRGQGVAENQKEAAAWFHKAAEQGHAQAQTYLGLMYVLGWGVQKNKIQAHKWWALAAGRGNPQAQMNLDNITGVMSPGALAEAHKLAREWTAVFERRRKK